MQSLAKLHLFISRFQKRKRKKKERKKNGISTDQREAYASRQKVHLKQLLPLDHFFTPSPGWWYEGAAKTEPLNGSDRPTDRRLCADGCGKCLVFPYSVSDNNQLAKPCTSSVLSAGIGLDTPMHDNDKTIRVLLSISERKATASKSTLCPTILDTSRQCSDNDRTKIVQKRLLSG